jgi:hypothetical protein
MARTCSLFCVDNKTSEAHCARTAAVWLLGAVGFWKILRGRAYRGQRLCGPAVTQDSLAAPSATPSGGLPNARQWTPQSRLEARPDHWSSRGDLLAIGLAIECCGIIGDLAWGGRMTAKV